MTSRGRVGIGVSLYELGLGQEQALLSLYERNPDEQKVKPEGDEAKQAEP
jgi:hypothetical protein